MPGRHDDAVTDISASLRELAVAHGVATEYTDWRGNDVDPSAQTVIAVLAGMGVDGSTPERAAIALATDRKARSARMLPPCVVTRAGRDLQVDVRVGGGEQVDGWVELEGGRTRVDLTRLQTTSAPLTGDEPTGSVSLVVPADLPLGYHTLHANSGRTTSSTTLIVTPAQLGLPARMGAGRSWGLATQLYSVRSRQSWGIGDLADLADLASWSGSEHGADFLLANPLHAAEPVAPMEPSPYLPTSRRFVNPIYLRIERIPEYGELEPAPRREVDRLQATLGAEVAGSDLIDRDAVWTAKREALQRVHAVPLSAERAAVYGAYRRREGPGLEDFATWSALAAMHGSNWRNWPPDLRHPRLPGVGMFRVQHEEQVDFYCWLQWMLDEQLATTQSTARDAGMALGVLHDLAVGVHPDGADAWGLQEVLAHGVSVGAPPDAFNQVGQDWSQPPWRPDRLAEQAYRPFREMVSTMLRHAGGVRVDHILGLFRLWWVPAGRPPTEGTYVRYDHEALVGVLALEAHRAGAIVVGEDLGTVEPWVRGYLDERGLLGTSILWFEVDEQGRPRDPTSWRECCLGSVTTHDLPPTAGYLDGEHVRLRHELQLLTRPLEEERADAEAERAAWLRELRARGLLAADADTEQIVLALHRFLTLTPARLQCVALTDAVGDRRTQNQPGTNDEYPNWRVPLAGPAGEPLLLEDVKSSARVTELFKLFDLR